VRYRDWHQALRLLAALPDSERQRPEVRLALGRAALETEDGAQAVAVLRGLDSELPSVREQIQQWVAHAAALAGPFDEAARTLSRSSRVADLIVAAQAYERAGNLASARSTVDDAVSRAGRLRHGAEEALARLTRAAMAEKAGQGTVSLLDWRWVVVTRPDYSRVREALAGIHRLKGPIALDAELDALGQTTSADNVDDTMQRIDELGKANKNQAPAIALGRARALFHARRYERAVTAYDALGKLSPAYRAEALYFAGRAAARAGDAEAALTRFRTVMFGLGRSDWAERAGLQRAELLLELGRFAEAATAFTQCLSLGGKGKDATAARQAQALAWLALGLAKKAKETFVALRKDQGASALTISLLRHLEALALLRAGDQSAAVHGWLEIAREEPLTFTALAARARLSAVGHGPLPPAMAAGGGQVPLLPVTLPPGPALLHGVGFDDEAERGLVAVEDSVTARYPGRESEALCALYAALSGARRRYQIGNRATSFEQLMRAPASSERWTWACVYPEPYPELGHGAEDRNGLPRGLVYAIMRQESAFREDAASDAGAIGLMQLMPETAARLARELSLTVTVADLTRPDVNIELGAHYLGKLLASFRGSLPLAIAAYNAGPQAVRQWLRSPSEREADLWVARIPYGETREYVQRVMGNLARYQYLAAGPDAVTPLDLALPRDVDVGDDAY